MSFLRNLTVGLTFGTFAQLLNALVGVLVIRKIGPLERGIYATVLTLNVMLTYLLDMGMSAANETFLGKGEQRVGAINCNSLIYSLGVGLLAFGLGLGFHAPLWEHLLPGIPFPYVLLGLAAVPITLYSLLAESILVGLEEIVLLNKISVLHALLLAGGSMVFVLIFNGGVKILVWVWVAAYGIVTIANFLVITHKDKFVFEPSLLRKSLKFGFKAALARSLRLGSYRIDTLFVNGMMGTTAAGYYSVASSLSEKVGPTLRAFTQAANRRITASKRESSYRLTARFVRALIVFLVAVIGPLIIGAHFIVQLLFGREFLPAVIPLRILLVGVAFFCVSVTLILFFQNQMKRPGFASGVIAVVLAVTSPMYFLAIPRWGMKGAAIVTSFAFFSMFLTYLISFLRINRMPAWEALLVQREDIERFISLLRVKTWINGIIPGGVKRL